jgi:hypothetical protein
MNVYHDHGGSLFVRAMIGRASQSHARFKSLPFWDFEPSIMRAALVGQGANKFPREKRENAGTGQFRPNSTRTNSRMETLK